MLRYSIYSIAFLNGILLLSLELISSKLMAPFFGNSYQVWCAMLLITLLSIALGYFISMKLTTRSGQLKQLALVNLIALILLCICLFFSREILTFCMNFSFLSGLLLAFSLLFLPLITLICTETPLLIAAMQKSGQKMDNPVNNLFFISTLGGVFGVYFFGFYWIPFFGIKQSLLLVCFVPLVILCLLFVAKRAYGKG